MKVVSNTTPLIGFASIQKFELLRKLFGEIYIPQAVYNEAVVKGHQEGGAKKEVSLGWINACIPLLENISAVNLNYSVRIHRHIG